MDNNAKLKLHSRVRHRRVGDDGVVVCMHNGTVLVVNEVGSFIIEKLMETSDSEQIIASLCLQFDVNDAQARFDFEHYINHLKDKNVVADDNETSLVT